MTRGALVILTELLCLSGHISITFMTYLAQPSTSSFSKLGKDTGQG